MYLKAVLLESKTCGNRDVLPNFLYGPYGRSWSLKYGSWETLHQAHGRSKRKRQLYPACSFMMFIRVSTVCVHYKIKSASLQKGARNQGRTSDNQLWMYYISPSPTLISPKHPSFSKTDRCCLFFLPKSCSPYCWESSCLWRSVMGNEVHQGKKPINQNLSKNILPYTEVEALRYVFYYHQNNKILN